MTTRLPLTNKVQRMVLMPLLLLTVALVTSTPQAASQTVTFWSSSTVPAVPDSGPDSAVELGLTFSSSEAGTVTGVQFYKGVGNTGTHTGHLWSSSGKSLASVTFTGETATGWQQANFATPVPITAGTTYVISYHTNVGHYADSQGFFTTALNVAPLTAPVNAGVYKYGSSSGFPNSTWNESNYWVQPVVDTGPPPPPAPPALSSVSMSPVSVVGGNSSTGTVTLTSAAPTGGITIALANSNTGVVSAPSSVTIAAGATSNTFPATTIAVSTSTAVTITASYNNVNKTATLTVTPPPPVTVTISPTAVTLAPGGMQQFTATVTGTSAEVNWAQTGGSVSSTGLYTAGATTGTFSVTASVTVGTTTTSATATVTISSSGSNVIFYDDFAGTTLSPAWTVISRHGEYSQDETECNVPSMVSVNNGLTITTEAQTATCGDYFNAPSSWPYITGDIQWTNFNFTYGTVAIEAKFPAEATSLWPATWLLGSNCQYTNPLTGDTGVTINGHTCPDFGATGYTEIDMTECYGSGSLWCGLSVYNPGFNGCTRLEYAVDTNWHLFKTVWNSSGVTQYVDGKEVASCTQNPSNPMFLIIQTQTGGVAGTPNNSDLPATLQVQYVQVTQP